MNEETKVEEKKQEYTLRQIGRERELKDKKVKGTFEEAVKAGRAHGKGKNVKIGVIDEKNRQVFTVVCGKPKVSPPLDDDSNVYIPDEGDEEPEEKKPKTRRTSRSRRR